MTQQKVMTEKYLMPQAMRTKHVEVAGGETLQLTQGACWIRKFAWESSAGPVIIMLPGATGCALFYKQFTEKVVQQCNQRALIFDRFNIGLSDRYLDEPNGLELWSKQIIEIMDHLQLENANFVGFSQGGTLLAFFGAHYPTRVNKVYMCSPVIGGIIGSAVGLKVRLMRNTLPKSWRAAFFRKIAIPKLVRRCKHQVEEGADPDGLEVAQDMYRVPGTAEAMSEELCETMYDIRLHGCLEMLQKYREQKIPTYIRCYKDDPDQNYNGLAKALALLQKEHPDMTIEETPGLHHEFYTDDTAQKIAEFMMKIY